MAAPATDASEIREFAFTRLSCSGSTRGTAAARVTPYALDATRTPRAAGNSATESPEPTAPASTQHRNARIAIVAPIAQRRPWLNRSRNGPISGATIANGSIVSPRNSATWPRAWSVGHLEEQRARQRDRHRRVAGAVERVQLDDPEQPAVAGALGVAGAPGLPEREAGGPPGRVARGPGAPAGRGPRAARALAAFGDIRSLRACRR